jgi:hypothetical protein
VKAMLRVSLLQLVSTTLAMLVFTSPAASRGPQLGQVLSGSKELTTRWIQLSRQSIVKSLAAQPHDGVRRSANDA